MASRRRYVTTTEAETYTGESTITEEQVDKAEELIDAFVGYQKKAISGEFHGQATSGTTTTLVDTSGDSPLDDFEDGYYVWCEVEVVGGTNEGEVRQITAYDKSASEITVNSAFGSGIDNTSYYVIRQFSKFPRNDESFLNADGDEYRKWIKPEVKRAVLAQIDYMVLHGEEFLKGATDKDSENIGDYSYQAKRGIDRMIAPLARDLLKGIKNRKGRIVV